MEHTSNFFSKHGKTAQNTATKIISVAILVLIVAVAVYFFRMSKGNSTESIPNTNQQNSQVEKSQNENYEVTDEQNQPENIDPSMIETNLNQTSKNLETIDNLDNF